MQNIVYRVPMEVRVLLPLSAKDSGKNARDIKEKFCKVISLQLSRAVRKNHLMSIIGDVDVEDQNVAICGCIDS